MDKNLLFILIVIITVVINIIKAIKKKGAAGSGPVVKAEVQPVESDFQEILRKMMGEEPKPKPAIPFESEYESLETLVPLGGYPSEETVYSFEEPVYAQSTLFSEAFDSERIKDPVPSVVHLVTPPTVQPEFTAKNFNLRQGIIYSAILDRPKF